MHHTVFLCRPKGRSRIDLRLRREVGTQFTNGSSFGVCDAIPRSTRAIHRESRIERTRRGNRVLLCPARLDAGKRAAAPYEPRRPRRAREQFSLAPALVEVKMRAAGVREWRP